MKKAVLAASAALLFITFSCDKNPLGPVDSNNDVPYVRGATLSPDSINIDPLTLTNGFYSANATLTATVVDPGATRGIQQVAYQVHEPGTGDVVQSGTLSLASPPGDSVALYTATIPLSIPEFGTGQYVFETSVLGASGLSSNTFQNGMVVFRRLDRAPHFVSINVPDSIQRPSTIQGGTVDFFVTVQDSDGLGDVASVFFIDFSATNPQDISMYDDGKNGGDVTAHDGIYSRTVLINNTAILGTLDFRFYVFDKAGKRDSLVHPITIY